ncbi:retrovirus-related pol polyprotein from transposon TNT 1-94 [Tanacetum coccineum]
MMTQKLGNGVEFIKKACFGRVTSQREIRPVWKNVQRVNYQNKLTHPHPKRNFVPTAVATKLGQIPVNAAKQNSPRAATLISIARPVNTARVNNVTTTGSKAVVSVAKGNRENVIIKRLMVDLLHLEEVLNEELKFNLLSVSQMCDKKNSVLFTETECLVLSPDFKILDESQCLLKVPETNIMYSFDLRFVVPSGDPLGKFDGKADEGFFVRYFINSKAFRVFNTRTRKLEENLHITFLENKPNVVGSGPDWLFDIDLLTNSMNYEPVTAGNQTNIIAGIKDNIDAVPTQQYILLPLLYDSPKSSEDAVADDAGKKTNEEPANEERSFTNVDDLPTDPLMLDLEDTPNLLNTSIFSGAYDDENVGAEADLNNLETTMNKVWRLVDLPKGKHAIGTKWVYRNKKDERGIVVRNKERLVAQGYTQEEGIDYDEVFAPVARIKVIRLFLAYASFMGFIVYQMDMKSAFLYGTIKEGVYVCQPPGFEDPQFPDKVYKVEKALYGLHQALETWVAGHAEEMMTRNKSFLIDYPKIDGGFVAFGGSTKGVIMLELALTGNPQQEVLWIQNQMLDYGFNFMNTKIYIDNESTICIVKNPVFHSKTKHIEIRHHFIRDSYEKRLIQVIKIHTDHNVADLLTKAFDAKHIEYMKCVKSQTPRQAKRGQDTKIPQSGGPPEKVDDEAIHKELGD